MPSDIETSGIQATRERPIIMSGDKRKPRRKWFWYDALVLATNGVHRVFYASQRPRIGSECPGVHTPNKVVGYKRYEA